ncbi:mRNA 3'-end-processing protein rna14 [Glutinoglossum americanum]|uniref:mRNA 3'-end-processing protein RNA14 n=1 Tax=Glutinoglossum americanum TaxID=1670608 RepID=A0A9P8I2M4_9PEZI|nr:mRNA 3'-end-processing protein rna14 [Glutinoglossum americanum]
MADAELAFLRSMQALNDQAGRYQTNDRPVGTVKEEPQSTEDYDHLQQVKDASFTANADDVSAQDVLSPTSASSLESTHRLHGSLDPSASFPASTSSAQVAPATSNPLPFSRSSSQGSVQKPSLPQTNLTSMRSHTIGGPVVDDDDDENETQLPATNSNGSLHAPFSRLGDDNSAKSTQSPPIPQVTTASQQNPASATVAPKARLPHDRVGILEDRIKEDPKGDMEAWLALIHEHRKRNKMEEARKVYERFFKVFPMAAELWVAYANMELGSNNLWHVEQIFGKALLKVPNVQLWSVYMDYVRRRNNLTTDTTSNARTIISQAYDFVIENVGQDRDSGRLWQDYIAFIKSGPGVVGGTSWQDQQKMDLLRKAYQRAICIPIQGVDMLWKEYDAFEKGLNKITGRKFLQEKSPAYMSARGAFIELNNITQGLNRTTLPRLPPALGFEGDEEYLKQVEIWKRWVQWEKDDPLVLKEEDPVAYKARMLYVFKQAIMALRFWPEIWFDASEFCFQEGLEKEGNDFLTQGIEANPESCLLAFKHADRLETTLPVEEGDEGLKRRGAAVREPYDKLLDASYELIAKIKARETQDIARIEDAPVIARQSTPNAGRGDDDDDEGNEADADAKRAAKEVQTRALKDGNAVRTQLLSKTISFTWIALMRAMRRVQGKGKVHSEVGGSRQIFTDARRRGRLTSDVYVASALLEHHCYKDTAATKIFERGAKLFPDDANFALEYLKHLIAINDITNARAVFETTVSKMSQKNAKPVYAFFHQYEAHYGELSQVIKLEKRMGDLYPEDPQLTRFSQRHSTPGFDPTAVRPIISPAIQMRPKGMPIPSHEVEQGTPPIRYAHITNSPKRPPPGDESDNEPARPRKLIRGESPLKGAAGRRLDQQKRSRLRNDGVEGQSSSAWQSQYLTSTPAPAIPRDVLFLLSIIPKAETYHATRFKAEEMVRLLRETNIPAGPSSLRPPPMLMGQGQQNGGYHTFIQYNSNLPLALQNGYPNRLFRSKLLSGREHRY